MQEVLNRLKKLADDAFTDSEELKGWLRNLALLAVKWNGAQAGKHIKQVLGEEIAMEETWQREVIEAWALENLTLVRSLSEDYIKRLNSIVSQGVQDDRTWNVIMEDVQGLDSTMRSSRARLLARDQIGKINGRLTRRRQQDLGIEMYVWLTAMDERVRGNPSGRFPQAIPSHYLMEGLVCRWDDSTVYSDDQGKTWKPRTNRMPASMPGIEIQCRCTALPFWKPLIESVDEELEKEKAAA